MADQDGVRLDHHAHLLQAQHGDQLIGGGPHQDIAAGPQAHLAHHRIAALVARRGLVDRLPGAEVGPGVVHRRHRRVAGLLHHRVVDRDLGRGEEVQAEVQDPALDVARGMGGAGLLGDRGGEAVQLLQQPFGGKDEVAAVPEIAGLDIGRRGLGVGLLDEAAELEDALADRQRRAELDIAVGRGGMGGPYAEGDDRALEGGGDGGLGGGAEGLDVGNVVVGGDADGDGAGMAGGDPARGGRHGRGGIAAFRLDDDEGLGPDLAELAADGLQVGLAGDHHRLGGALQPRHAQHRVLEQRALAQEGQELLRTRRPRGRRRSAYLWHEGQ